MPSRAVRHVRRVVSTVRPGETASGSRQQQVANNNDVGVVGTVPARRVTKKIGRTSRQKKTVGPTQEKMRTKHALSRLLEMPLDVLYEARSCGSQI